VVGDSRRADRAHRLGLVDEIHALEEARHELVAGGLGELGPVGLGDVLLGRRQVVDEGAVVGEQQQAGGVHVEPPDALHVALDELVRQQRIHAPVVLGLVGAFVAGGLVEGEVGLLAVDQVSPSTSKTRPAVATSMPGLSTTSPWMRTSPSSMSWRHWRRLPKPWP
jgi:enoyl-CoA hydratase/carnithine racemase